MSFPQETHVTLMRTSLASCVFKVLLYDSLRMWQMFRRLWDLNVEHRLLCPSRRVTAAAAWATTRRRCRPRPAPARRSCASTSRRPPTRRRPSGSSPSAAPTSSPWVPRWYKRVVFKFYLVFVVCNVPLMGFFSHRCVTFADDTVLFNFNFS